MTKNFIGMGDYYRSNEQELVRTVCRGTDVVTGNSVIAFVKVLSGGIASEIYFMEENDFKSKFI